MGHLVAPTSRPLETSCLKVPERDAEVLGNLPQEVVNTITVGESTVYETRLCLEVEPVHRMVLFSQRRPPGSARSESYCPFCSKGWSEVCLPPPLKSMLLRLLPTTTPWMGRWWGCMTGLSGSLGEREG